MNMILAELKAKLLAATNEVPRAVSPTAFMSAARVVCELARSANFVASDAYSPSLRETLELSRLLELSAATVRGRIGEIRDLSAQDASLAAEFADHINERAGDLRELAFALFSSGLHAADVFAS